MTLRHLKIFVRVYQSQSVTKAAEQLHMTQPAVSRSIQELEHYYGVQLFQRMNRRLSATEIGKSLYLKSLSILDSFEDLEQGLYNWDAFGVFRIGTSVTIGNYFLPHLLLKFQEKYPNVKVELMICNSAELQTALCQNKLDVALVEHIVDHEELVSQVFAQDEMILITPPHHPILEKEQIILSDILEYPLIMREVGSAGRSYLDAIFSTNGLTIKPIGTSISTQAIVRLVSYGLGISILPLQLVEDDCDKGIVSMKRIDGTHLYRQHYITWHPSKHTSHVMQDFIFLCKDLASTVEIIAK